MHIPHRNRRASLEVGKDRAYQAFLNYYEDLFQEEADSDGSPVGEFRYADDAVVDSEVNIKIHHASGTNL